MSSGVYVLGGICPREYVSGGLVSMGYLSGGGGILSCHPLC